METILCFMLVFLVCSVSAGQTEADNEILENQIEVQKPCPQDIHAVLRELTASLAVQNEKISVLQKENQGHEAKLKELEMQKTEIEQLKQQLLVQRVAFSASLMDEESKTFGPFNTHTVLTFKHVVANIGNAYNPHTGIFTAPVRGAYQFEFYIASQGDPTCAVLVKNGQHIFTAWRNQQSQFGSSSNGVTLILEVGDQVFMRLWANYKIYDDRHHYSTFSGHLLFIM